MKTIVIAFAIVFSGILVRAQVNTEYLQDTLWMKSGKAIPCKIAFIDSANHQITIKYYDANEILTYEPMAFELIETYIIVPEINPYNTITEEKKPLLPDSLKSVRTYLGLGFGFPFSAGLSFTIILKNDWGGSLSYKYTCFDKGLGSGVIPGDRFNEFSFCAVKEFPAKTTKWVRYGLEAGPSFVKYEKVEQTHRVSGWLGPYYTKETSEHTTMGLSLRAKLEFLVARGFGFEIAAYTNINSYRPHAGIEFYINLGRVKDRIKPKH